jgi:hypothetical protein
MNLTRRFFLRSAGKSTAKAGAVLAIPTAAMATQKPNTDGLVHHELVPQEATIPWRKEGRESPHAEQSVILYSKAKWKRLVEETPDFATWSTITFSVGLVAISPYRYIDRETQKLCAEHGL